MTAEQSTEFCLRLLGAGIPLTLLMDLYRPAAPPPAGEHDSPFLSTRPAPPPPGCRSA